MTPTVGQHVSADEVVDGLLRPGGIHAVFQPLVRLADGAVVGYEALARSVAVTDLGPAQWLRLADAVGKRVEVELACLHAAAVAGAPPKGALLFVNVSAQLLLDDRFDVIRAELSPHVLEVTEHEPVVDYPPLRARLARWAESGTLLAVDDVGAGYASMAHVLRLNPAFIKIDQALIAGLHLDSRQQSLVGALVAFARSVGSTSVAEGVETSGELEALREVGVDLVQGYLLARPAPPWPAAADAGRLAGTRDRALSRAIRPGAIAAPDAGPEPGSLASRLAAATHPADAAAAVASFLISDRRLLPTVYLERGGVLRCVARAGQWLVLDGITAGVGLTGAAFESGCELLVADVASDPRYRAAVPDVVSELAVPLRVGDRVVGVLNVDATSPLDDSDIEAVRECARLLVARLADVGTGESGASALQQLGRMAPFIAGAADPKALAELTVDGVVAMTGLESAVLWTWESGRLEISAATGPDAPKLAELNADQRRELAELVAELSSVHTSGSALDLVWGPTRVLRERGVRAVLLVPLRDGRRFAGVLCVVSSVDAHIADEAVEAAELLCLHAGSRQAALRRMDHLHGMAYRDQLTGIGNRSRLEQLLEDRRERPTEFGWLAVVDVDRFKQVNDTYGHVTGDRVLRDVAQLLRGGTSDDVAFRLGGDEFVLLLPPMPPEAALAVLTDIRSRASGPLSEFGADLSMGLAHARDDRGSLHDALLAADGALYDRKRAGGGGVTVAEPAPPAAAEPGDAEQLG